MTKRSPVSYPQNIWFDSRQVDASDLQLEQNHNSVIENGIINNHIGTGTLADVLVPKVLWDSESWLIENPGTIDGKVISSELQPSDNNQGNQLEIQLTNSKTAGKRNVKLIILGLDFEDNLFYETFIFKTNEIQISRKHFKSIVGMVFNDFVGSSTISFNLGGRLIIREAKPLSLSRDCKSVAQDYEPSLVFRDFFADGAASLEALLTASLPLYNISSLNIKTQPSSYKTLPANDVTTHVGQKFKAAVNNIQKVTLLLSVVNTTPGQELQLDWAGDLVVSIYPLQTSLECPVDILPNLPIQFPPSNIPLAQISLNYNSLEALGYVLNGIPQPIDFVFSNTQVSTGNNITAGNLYAVTIKRSGSATKCDIQLACGSDWVTDSQYTTFNGSLWTDSTTEDLWFQIWSDSAKVSDGKGYDTGVGFEINKTWTNTSTGLEEDYVLSNLAFANNEVYTAVSFAKEIATKQVAHPITGSPVNSEKDIEAQVQLLRDIELTSLQQTTEPFRIGNIVDKNVKFFDVLNSQINTALYTFTTVNNEILIKIIEDIDDPRYDSSVLNLVTEFNSGNLVNAKITPNATVPSNFFRIAKAEMLNMIYGDVNGDGVVDDLDVTLLNSYVGFSFNQSPPLNTSIVTNGITTTVTNGYTTHINPFVNETNVVFQVINPGTGAVVLSGIDGVLVLDPTNSRNAQLSSTSVLFSSLVITDYKIVIISGNVPNNGKFDILGINTSTDVITIGKIIYSSESMLEMLRSDIDGNFVIDDNDGYLLSNYVDKKPFAAYSYPFPPTIPYSRIGTKFKVIRLVLEPYVDRNDDYSTNPVARNAVTHSLIDVFSSNASFQNKAYYTTVVNPIFITINKRFSWEEYLISGNFDSRFVPSVFTYQNGYETFPCVLTGVEKDVYPPKPSFNKGKVNLFVPNDVVIGDGGQLTTQDGDYYKVDFEIGTVVLEIPGGLYSTEKTINVIDDLIADFNGYGVTRLGFKSMRFADCSFVQRDSLTKDQVRFSVSVQSFSPNVNEDSLLGGMDEDGISGAIVDGKIGVHIDYETGLLTLNFTNLFEDPTLRTLNTKVQVTVFLKKAGFNNKTLFLDSVKVQNILKLISVFSGDLVGGPSALIDLVNDVTGILPIIYGGTGLGAVGPAGSTLVSDGYTLSYQTITGTFTAGCDLAGTETCQTVVGVMGYPISGTPLAGQSLKFDGVNMVWGDSTVFSITSFTTSPTLVEVGQAVNTPAFTASYSLAVTGATLHDTDNITPVALTLPATSFSSGNSFTKTGINNTVTFTLTASRTGNSNVTSNRVVTWGRRVFYGVNVSGSPTFDESFIETGLTAGANSVATGYARSITIASGNPGYIYYCIPSAFGTLTGSNFVVGGFAGGFSQVASGISVTNGYSVAHNYDIYRSDNTNLASVSSITIVVS